MKQKLLLIIITLLCISCSDKTDKITDINEPNVPSEIRNSNPIILSQQAHAQYATFIPQMHRSLLSLIPTALDPSNPDVSCIYLIEVNSGRQASTPLCIHSKTGVIEWTPSTGDAGIYNISFKATDPNGAFDEEIVQITVYSINEPPYLFVKMENYKK